MTENAIQLAAVTKGYGAEPVLNGLDFVLPRGSVVGLLGKNGAGKSTLIKCALGLLRINSGSCRVFDEDPWNMPFQVKQRVGYVPQEASGFSWMRVSDMLEYTGAFYRNWQRSRVDRLLQIWELKSTERLGALSVGQRQKLAIICAMGHDPDLLILDEPVAGLDPVSRRRFLEELIDLNVGAERSILFSTHITSDLERVAARLAVLKEGRIQFDGELDDLRERVRRVHVHSDRMAPEKLPIPHVLSSKFTGKQAILTVDYWKDDLVAQLEALGAHVQVEHLNLEEFFLEVHA